MFLQSCVPAKFTGYIPTGPGTAEKGYCVAGIKDNLRVRTGSGVDIVIWGNDNERNRTIALKVDIIVPEAVTVQLVAPDFVLRSSEWPQQHVLVVDRIIGPGPRSEPKTYGPTEKLVGVGGSGSHFLPWFLKGEKGTLYQTMIPKVKSFTLQPPPLSINGQTYRIDPITFEAYEKLSVYTCVQ